MAERSLFKMYLAFYVRNAIINPAAKFQKTTFTEIIYIIMSNGNRKKAKTPSRFTNAATGKTYTKATDNVKAAKAAEGYAIANPKKAFYA